MASRSSHFEASDNIFIISCITIRIRRQGSEQTEYVIKIYSSVSVSQHVLTTGVLAVLRNDMTLEDRA
jgi:hypothetical protein